MALTTRTLIAAVTAFAILALTAGSAEATHSRGKCKARGDTIAKNDTGRVYEREQDAEVKTLWGCVWERNKAFKIEVAEGDGFVTFESYDNVMLRGRFVAWTFTHEDISCKADCPPGYDATTEYVKTFDLKTRDEDLETSDAYPGSLRLNRGGSLAWLTSAGDGNLEVHAWDGDGARTFDTGMITKFRLRGPTLSWVNGGDLGRIERLSGSAAGAARATSR
jgi:hypothetical protein